MTKRRDPESIIVQYFTEAAPEAAAILFRVVRGILDTRGILGKRPAVPTATPVRARRRKTNGGAEVAEGVAVTE